MAKERPREYRMTSPMTGQQIEEARRRLRDAFPGYRDAFPLEIRLKADYKAKWLPAVPTTPGLSVADSLRLACELDPARVTPAVVLDLYRGLPKIKPKPAYPPFLSIDYYYQLPQRPEHPQRGQLGDLSLTIRQGGHELGFYTGGINLGTEDGKEFRGDQEARYFRNERLLTEEMTRLAIDAGRLPLRIIPSGPSFTVEATGTAVLENMFEPHEYGSSFFRCRLPDDTPEIVTRRFFDILAALPNTEPPRFTGRTSLRRTSPKADPIPAAYAHLQAHRWPSLTCKLETALRLEGPEALDGLRAFPPGPAAVVRVELGEIRPEGQKARSPTVKLLARTRAGVHHLILKLPPELLPIRQRVEKVIGRKFED